MAKRKNAPAIQARTRQRQKEHQERFGVPLPASALVGIRGTPRSRKPAAEPTPVEETATEEQPRTVAKPVTLAGGYVWNGPGLLTRR